ncbi:membrane protein [Thermaurantimonas aggregans]|uniref:Membrane protein n=1 Tax=Thermaurantimonas aggregans TaxID=2173829 RepID=A0A401XI84_9FLAO|nr:outer membrane lipoprotein carrier protein LolA [Thermaurantimonas aggregans]MCX8149286.1 outer membrane lipoprotein carrier protein LolA [Thermaurantimonas aggregans]GCD76684.1 membrane protein [Thermaurantimonas aggregans]
MHRLFIYLFIFNLLSFYSNAQTTHKEAKALLNKAADKLQNGKPYVIDFEYLFENQKVNPPVQQSEKGQIMLKGNNYKLTFMGMEQIFDGKKLYNILLDDKEIQVMQPEENDVVSPSAILNQYREGHTYYLGGKKKINNITHEVIVIKPKATADVDYIEVTINPKNHQIHSLMQRSRDGAATTFKILKIAENAAGVDISFQKDRYKGFKIIQ